MDGYRAHTSKGFLVKVFITPTIYVVCVQRSTDQIVLSVSLRAALLGGTRCWGPKAWTRAMWISGPSIRGGIASSRYDVSDSG